MGNRPKIQKDLQPTPRLLAAWIFENEPWITDDQLDKLLRRYFPGDNLRPGAHYRILWQRGKMLCAPFEDPRKQLD